MSPVMTEPDGLRNALQSLATATSRNFNVGCDFLSPTPVRIHDNVAATHLYRIAQEALHNAIRHGRAKRILIELASQDGRLTLAVRDDGSGFSGPPTRHAGIGLRVMRHRASTIGGALDVHSQAQGGTCVTCSIQTPATPAPAPRVTASYFRLRPRAAKPAQP
jgi:signal transduction histidine kinase